ncbi:Permease of the major facilitator superfamily protein [Paenibacillus terrae HPL-003]|uniref:Permease of the major facilitator superfamily protein n=1 Tax=Paenibacillus terrae (strain HPL-003) TaxID=985665 RepID=G7W3Z5_PAETH|nr:MFS transporter [Paenibacillus terrae]AET59235.1 Permease of the major facilitator superfamily protein [Paenibacillus terrae HPL-003]
MVKRSSFSVATGLYVNYLLFGMFNIMLASHMSFLTEHLNTDQVGISLLVSAMGFGRLFTLYISGVLSDRYGRKPFIVAAGLLMAVFLVGIPLSPSFEIAMVLAVLAGVANSFLDSGTYPALIEAFPQSSGSATVLVRGFISIGAAFLPLMIIFFMKHDIFYGFSFFLPALIFTLNAVYLFKMKFPDMRVQAPKDSIRDSPATNVEQQTVKPEANDRSKPRFWQEGIYLILLGFTGPTLLYIVQLWLPTFGQQFIGMTESESLSLLVYYNAGSLVSVFVLVIVLRKWIKPVHIILIYPCISLLAFGALLLFKSQAAAIISSCVIGFSISGVLQLTLTVMSEFFSQRKGQITGFIYTATSLSYTVIPVFTGFLLKHSQISSVFMLAIIVNVLGIVLAIFVNFRYSTVFPATRKLPSKIVLETE